MQNIRKLYKYFLITGSLLLLFALIVGYSYYQRIYKSNIVIDSNTTRYLYIPTNSNIDSVTVILKKKNYLSNTKSFIWLAEKKNYAAHIHPGRYLLTKGMNNNELINLLRKGEQKPLKLIFNNVRTIEDLAGCVGNQIEADSSDLIELMHNLDFVEDLGFNKFSFPCIFIPNTYEFWWNTSSKAFINRMYKEYLKFWNLKRLKQAKNNNLSPQEVITIASIVDEETWKNDEMSRIAGVYINRLQHRIPLQADPTIKFAVGDFSIKRVLTKHLKVESPYNTYKHYGLPPGPISIPSIAAIDAVLNYEHHKYLYFCAKDDFSGYHNFAKNLNEHNRNARAYRRALNKKRIWK